MSKSKFASLTAGLLARKGEAVPSAHAAFALQSAFDLAHHAPAAEPQKTGSHRPGDLSQLIERAAQPPRAWPQEVSNPALPDEMPVLAAVSPAPAADSPPAAAPPRHEPKDAPLSRRQAAPSFGLRGRLPSRLSLVEEVARLGQRAHRTAVTVRLDDARYLRLKLTGARFHRTNQEILTRALDAYLTALGVEEVDDVALSRWRAGGEA